jgi:predicted RecB family nuclease
VKLHHSATFLKQNVEGDVDLNGALSYKPEEGAFYLKDVEIVDLTGNDHSLSSHPQLRSTLQKVIIRVLDSMPVYHLRQDDFKQQLAKLFLKNVRVKDETLILTVGL